MNERSKNIDILFRNGLKEFEVLPPSDVWENIKPSLVKRDRSLNVYRLAAMIAILISVSAAAVWFTQRISGEFYGPALSLNQEFAPEGSYIAAARIGKMKVAESQTLNNGPDVPLMVSESVNENPVNIATYSSEIVTSPGMESQLSTNNLIPSKSAVKNSFSSEINKHLISSSAKTTVNKLNRWTLIAMASPDYYSNMNNGNNQVTSELAKSEKPVLSYSGGMGFSYKVNKRVSVQSGVIYSSVGQQVTGISSFSGFSNYNNAKGASAFSVQTSNGMIVSDNSNVFLRDDLSSRVFSQYIADSFDPAKANLTYLNSSVTQNFNYLEIPVMLRYKAIDRKIDVNLVGGLSYNMLVGNSVFARVDGEKYSIGKTEGLNAINLSSALGVGLEYNLSGKVSLNIEPTFRYYLTPFGTLSGTFVHPYSFGVLSGLSYKF